MSATPKDPKVCALCGEDCDCLSRGMVCDCWVCTSPVMPSTDLQPHPVYALGVERASCLPILPAPASDLSGLFLQSIDGLTRVAYKRDLMLFTQWVATASGLPEAAALTGFVAQGPLEGHRLALGYRAQLNEQGLAPGTVNRRLSTLRQVVRFAKILGLCTWELDLRNMKDEGYRDTRGPGTDVVGAILVYLATEATKDGLEGQEGRRDLCVLQLLYYLGLRRGEVASLDVEHVDLAQKRVWIRGKGHGNREALTIPDPLIVTLTQVLHDRLGQSYLKPGPLAKAPMFVNLRRASKGVPAGQNRLTGAGVWVIVERRGQEATQTKTWPHGIRHTAISEALRLLNGNVRAVQGFSRHADVRTVVIYDDNRIDAGGQVAALLSAPPPPRGDKEKP